MTGRRIVAGMAFSMLALASMAGCAHSSGVAVSPPERAPAFSFVVMGDNRPGGSGDGIAQPQAFHRAIAEVNLFDPDLVVIVGDLILGYTQDVAKLNAMWDAFDAACAKFTVPYYQVIGNHDVSTEKMQRLYLERYGRRFPLFYSFDHEGCHFIVLDSDLHGEYRNVTGAQVEWLKADLERSKGARKTFVFLHYPLWNYSESDWMSKVHPLLAEYGVDTVFCGHEHTYRKDPTLDGVRYIVTGGAGAPFEGAEVTGGFFHYCVVSVRGDDVSIAVVRTGEVENEEIVNQEVWRKRDVVVSRLAPLAIKLKRGAAKLPGQLEIVVENPFEEALSGTLTWQVPDGSPWRLPKREEQISVEPGARQTLTVPVPPGGSSTDLTPISPLPTAQWDLMVGRRSLMTEQKAEIIVDRWPYAQAMSVLSAGARMEGVRPILAAPVTQARLVLPVKNPTQWTMRSDLSVEIPDACRWKVTPLTRTVAKLAPGKEAEVAFDVRFKGNADDVFPLPRVSSVVVVDGEEVLRDSAPLPVNVRPLFAAKEFVAPCRRAAAPPKLDGVLNDAVWKQSDVLSGFLRMNPLRASDYRTEVRLARDARNLYVAFRCGEPNLPGLVVDAAGRDKDVWKDDCVEVFIDTNLDRKTYFHFIFNAAGVVQDGRQMDDSWNGECTVKTGREANAWTAEIAIPWATLGLDAPEIGTRIGLELARTRAQEPGEISQWAPTRIWNHEPERFGTLSVE